MNLRFVLLSKSLSDEKGAAGFSLIFFLNGLTLSAFVKPWFLGLPMFAVSLVYLIQGLQQEDQSDQSTKAKDKTKS